VLDVLLGLRRDGGGGVLDAMEIARPTAICRKSDCGPLENELVRLRAQIATLEEGKADLTGGRGQGQNHGSLYALFEKQLARKDAKVEVEERIGLISRQLWKMRRLISRQLWKRRRSSSSSGANAQTALGTKLITKRWTRTCSSAVRYSN
jgi:hypothetical protein